MEPVKKMSSAQRVRLFLLALATGLLCTVSGMTYANDSSTPSPKATDDLWPCIGAADWIYTLWDDDGSVKPGFPLSLKATVACKPPSRVGPWGEAQLVATYPGCEAHVTYKGEDPLDVMNAFVDATREMNTCIYIKDAAERTFLGLEPVYQWGEACTSPAANSALIYPYHETLDEPKYEFGNNPELTFGIGNVMYRPSLPYCGGKAPLAYQPDASSRLYATYACAPEAKFVNKPVGKGTCVPIVPPSELPPACGNLVGHPVDVSSGHQVENATDYAGENGLRFSRSYNSGASSRGSTLPWGSTIEFSRILAVKDVGATRYTAFAVESADGTQRAYNLQDDNSLKSITGNTQSKLALVMQATPTPNALTMDSVPAGTTIYITGYTLTNPDGSFEQYDYQGALVSRTAANNSTQTFTYADSETGRNLATLSDFTGRTLSFEYNTRNQLVRMTDPAAGVYQYEYLPDAENRDGSKLNKVIYPDLTSIGYTYVPGTNNLSSIIDQNGASYNTMQYNPIENQFQSVSSQLIGGVDGFTFAYARYGGTYFDPDYLHVDITDSLGVTTDRWYQKINGVRRLTSQSQPAGSGCAAATSKAAYNAAGRRLSSDDFNGGRTCYMSTAADAARDLDTWVVEGLSNTNACGGSLGSYTYSGSVRAKTTTWHPDAAVPEAVATPGRLTQYIYNGRPDPTNGNAAASCMPGTLPNGKAPMVLCKTIVKATTDLTGAAGIYAEFDPAVQPVVSSLTYNADGQVLTSKDPGGAITQFAYYSSSGVGHTKGDLASVTNPKLQVTTFDAYNAHGDVLQSTSFNGLVTVMTYDSMRRLLTASAGGLTETYTYKPFGAIDTRTAPNGGITRYAYDPAHRLVSITDASGNVQTKILDTAGGVTSETVQDSQGTIARSVTRVFDALHRVQQVTGAH